MSTLAASLQGVDQGFPRARPCLPDAKVVK
jgi:hypothetical protein